LHPAVGLHPELAAQRRHELPKLLELIERTTFVGEVGLDYVTTDASDRAIQRKVFEAVLSRCAELEGKVISVHSRKATSDVVAMAGQASPSAVILHWFSGPLGLLERALDTGCYFSVNPAMVRSASGQEIVKRIPKSRILTETDGPFVKIKGKAARPRDLAIVISYLAQLWQLADQDVMQLISLNFSNVVNSVQAQPKL
jgi:TatD DNase family protein